VQATAQAAAAGQGAKMSSPQKFENKETGPDIRQWLSIVEKYLTETPGCSVPEVCSVIPWG
jgi:hypothetical protein